MNRLKDYWWVFLVFLAIAGWLFDYWGTRTMAADAAKKARALEATQITMAQIVAKDHAKLEGWMEALGIAPENARQWSRLPKRPPVDSSGVPIVGGEWLEVTDDLYVGRLMRFADSGNVEVTVLWDITDE